MTGLVCTILHTPDRSLGYGRAGVDISAALMRRGVTVFDSTEGIGDHDDRFVRPGTSNTVVWCSVPNHVSGYYDGQRAVVYTMWEACTLPESFRESLHEYDQIIVPSPHNLELFSEFHDNVVYVPLGVGSEWHYRNRPPPTNEFRFLTSGSGSRKGVDLAVDAFRCAFPNRDGMSPRPVMVHKNPKGPQYVGVETHGGYLDPQAELELYAGAHCYVGAARGEGFGLMPLQAIAMGLPTILSNAHGHESYAHLGLPVDCDFEEADYFVYGYAGQWWRPRFDDLVDRMRWVYNNYGQANAHAAVNAIRAMTEFSWDVSARKLVAALGPQHLTPYEGPGTWHDTIIKRFHIRVLVPWDGNVAGRAIHFDPDTDYWDLADLKRMVHETGHLDPACMGDDGVLPADGLLSGGDHYCKTCKQKLGSQPTKADAIFAELEARAAARG